MINRWTSILSRIFMVIAFILLLMAISDKILNIFGYTWTWWFFTAGRLLELSAMLMIFVMVLLLRQIREQLKTPAR